MRLRATLLLTSVGSTCIACGALVGLGEIPSVSPPLLDGATEPSNAADVSSEQAGQPVPRDDAADAGGDAWLTPASDASTDDSGLGGDSPLLPISTACLDTASTCQSSNPYPLFIWTNGVVPYSFTNNIGPGDVQLTASEQAVFTNAMSRWTAKTADTIQFVPQTDQTTYLTIEKVPGTGLAALGAGTFSGDQRHIQMNGISVNIAAHELGHILGLYFEQERFDRDRYLTVNPAVIGDRGSTCTASSVAPDFNGTWTKCPLAEQYGTFDFSSIMLLNGDDSTLAGVPSYTKKDSSPACGWECTIDTPTYGDGSAVLETYYSRDGWKPFLSLGMDLGATQPLATDLDPFHRNSVSRVDPMGRVSPFYYADAPDADASTAPLQMRAAVRGSDGRIWIRASQNDVWQGDWAPIPGQTFSTDPAGVSWGPGRMDIVATGVDGQVYQASYDEGAWTVGWTPVGAPSTGASSGPAISSMAAGSLDVFVIGGDGYLWQESWRGNQWLAWTLVSSAVALVDNPAAASPGAGAIEVAARSADGGIYRMTYASTWGSWQQIGAPGASGVGSPAVASWGPNRIDWFVRGADDGFIWQRSLANGSLSDWQALGAILTGDPGACESPAENGVDVMGLSNDTSSGSPSNGVWHKRWRPM
jgi:hypothetical protein